MAADECAARPPTVRDVAVASGVSIATVSRALQGEGPVSKDTQERVENAARRLGYRPNLDAARLRKGGGRAVAIIVSHLDSWYTSTVLAAAESVLTGAGLEIRLFVIDGDESRQRFIQTMMPRGIGGVIVIDLDAEELELHRFLDTHTPGVVIGSEAQGASSIVIDNEVVGLLATRHLLELGHRRVGLISGSPGTDVAHVSPVDARFDGYRRAHEEREMTPDLELVVSGGYSITGGYEAMSQLLSQPEPPSAVFAMSDEMAIGAMRSANDRGLSIPDELSIVGVDDHPMAWVCDLTTVCHAVEDHGALAASFIVEQIDSSERSSNAMAPDVELIVRGTTAAPGAT